jgi:hypothetical protein
MALVFAMVRCDAGPTCCECRCHDPPPGTGGGITVDSGGCRIRIEGPEVEDCEADCEAACGKPGCQLPVVSSSECAAE